MESANPAKSERLPTGKIAAFATAAMPVAALGIPLTVFLPNYYASHIGLSLAAVSGAFALVRLIDIVFDPLVGITINSTHLPLGRFRPWMLMGAPLLMIAAYAIFMAEPGISKLYMVGWLLVLYAGFSLITLGHSSWAAALVPEYHQRSRIYGWMQAVGVLATITVLALPPLLSTVWHKTAAQGVQAMGWFVIIVVPISLALCMSVVGEPKQTEQRHTISFRDYWTMLARTSLLRLLGSDLALALGPAITAALYIFFFTEVLGFTRNQTSLLLLIYIFAGLSGAPSWARVSRRLGKHQTVMLACVLYGFAQALVFVMPHGKMLTMVPGMFFAGFVVSAFTFLIRAMIADIGDEVRLEIGKDRTALLYGLVSSTSKVGSTISVPITFNIIAAFGFNPKEGAVNSGIALDALTACYVIVPILTMFVGAFLLRGYKLDAKRHGEIRDALAERDGALDGAGGVIESLSGVGAVNAPGAAAIQLSPGE